MNLNKIDEKLKHCKNFTKAKVTAVEGISDKCINREEETKKKEEKGTDSVDFDSSSKIS